MLPKIIFFARDYQVKLFPKLKSDQYTSLFVTLTTKEKRELENNGVEVIACFEEELDRLENDALPSTYLKSSLVADRFFNKFSLDERRQILSKEIKFWSKIFDYYKPVAVINEVIAIEIAEVMYIEATARGIKYLGWMVSPFERKNFYWLDIPFHARLSHKVFETLPDLDSRNFADQYYGKLHNADNVKPFYASNLSSRYNVVIFIKWLILLVLKTLRSITDTGKNKFLKSYYFDKTDLINKIKNFINSLLHKYGVFPLNTKIVFYPLHYEPEASILYMSEFFEDQAALIRNISKCLRNDQILVVKEHPQQPGMLLSSKYRLLKKSLSNVCFLPAEFSTKYLIQNSELIITQTSTAGWESLILGKPVVVFGKVFYDQHPSIVKFQGFENLRDLIHTQSYPVPNKEETITYIAQLWKYCESGNPFPTSRLYDEENIKCLVGAIEGKLRTEGLL